MTATGDAITGPGAPTVMIAGLPASVITDTVSGAACVGVVTQGSMTVTIEGRLATWITSVVTGDNPESGVPVATAVATGAPNVIIGA